MLRRWLVALGLAATPAGGQWAAPVFPSAQGPRAPRPPALRVKGSHFIDPAGRVVVLRGVNVSGGAKVPPFLPLNDLSDLDRLPPFGFNAMRLVFIWEAFEPVPGGYDGAYLARMRGIAEAAWARGMYVIVDIHQDGFSRSLSRGSGDGFPLWAVSPRAMATTPDNGPDCKGWPILMATDPNMHRSFSDFYADRAGVRTRYLLMLRQVATAFAGCPGVIGYDLLNEPWGDERREISPLYRDAAAVVRACDPAAILFLEGHVTTNCGLQTRLDRPGYGGVSYAPHYYKPTMILLKRWNGSTYTSDRAFANMGAKADEWGVPLFLSEFGAPAEAEHAGEYLDYLYDRMDDALASGAQWNYCPTWNDRDKDGWNGEDFHILYPDGRSRPNFPDRPHPRAVAGVPLRFHFRRASCPHDRHSVEFTWEHRPELGETEVFVPTRLFPRPSSLTIDGPGASCGRDEARQLLVCRAARPGLVRVRLVAP